MPEQQTLSIIVCEQCDNCWQMDEPTPDAVYCPFCGNYSNLIDVTENKD